MKLLTILFFSVASSWSIAQDKWEVADSATVRLPPSAFSQLPEKIVRNLQGRGCTVPQTYLSGKPNNVISGELARRGKLIGLSYALEMENHQFWSFGAAPQNLSQRLPKLPTGVFCKP